MLRILSATAAAGLFLWGVWNIPKFWSGAREYRLDQNPFGPRFVLRALRRQWHLTLGLSIAILTFIASGPSQKSTHHSIVGDLSGLAFLALLTVVISVALVNRPKTFVPRRFRDEPGIVEELVSYLVSRRRRID